MFRRKKDETDDLRTPGEAPPPIGGDGADEDPTVQPLRPQPKRGMTGVASPPAPLRGDIPRRTVEIPSPARRYERHGETQSEGKKLIVGRDIELAGEITACDRLVVEGKVSADLTDAGAIDVAQTGTFRGSAEVDEADISGFFDGNLTVRRKLTVRATGRIRGTVRYARIVIELGGEIHGNVEVIGLSGGEEEVRQLTSRDDVLVPEHT
ncbi:MAG: polymer-forming cytoskeletal protein [Alphaproteobacteria bacterium]